MNGISAPGAISTTEQKKVFRSHLLKALADATQVGDSVSLPTAQRFVSRRGQPTRALPLTKNENDWAVHESRGETSRTSYPIRLAWASC